MEVPGCPVLLCTLPGAARAQWDSSAGGRFVLLSFPVWAKASPDLYFGSSKHLRDSSVLGCLLVLGVPGNLRFS